MAKRLTRYILFALVLGVIAGWAINAAIDDGSPESAARLKSIADYLSIVTTLFLRLIKMIIAPLVFSTLVAGIAHMGDVAALGRVGLRSILWFILATFVSLSPCRTGHGRASGMPSTMEPRRSGNFRTRS